VVGRRLQQYRGDRIKLLAMDPRPRQGVHLRLLLIPNYLRRMQSPGLAVAKPGRAGGGNVTSFRHCGAGRYFNHNWLSKRNKMSNLTSFIVLAGLLFFPGPAPADEAGSIAALCARRDLREARQEMTVRDTAAATGIKESTLRQLLKGLGKEGEIRCGG
jgi:hypothetical protein